MTYTPYPALSEASAVTPSSVKWAKGLMWGLAILDFLVVGLILVVGLLVGGTLLSQELGSEAGSVVGAIGGFLVFIALILVGLWLLVLIGFGKRRGWARICAAVFFGLRTLATVPSLFQEGTDASQLVIPLLATVAGAASMYFLFSRDTTQWLEGAVVPAIGYADAGITPYATTDAWGQQPQDQWGQQPQDQWGQQPQDQWGQQPQDPWGQPDPAVPSADGQPGNQPPSQQPPTHWT